MGQRNMVYTDPMLETENTHLHPEPCVMPYGFPQPNNHSILPPPPGTLTAFNPQHLPENHVPLPHGITQFNGVDHHHHHHHHHHPANNVFMTPRVFPVAVNHAMQDQLPYSTIRGNFEISGQFMDVFKRKNAEGFLGNVQYFYPAMGASSSSVGISMNTEGTSRLIPGSYGGQPLQAVPNPWLDQQFCGNGSDNAVFSWNHGPSIPYLQGPINGGGMEAANVGLHGYQVATNTRNPTAFVHPPGVTSHPGPHILHPPPPPPPMPPMQGLNIDFHSQLASTSRRIPTNNTINPFQNGIELGPRFVGPAPPTGLRVYRPHRRELMVDATARHRGFPVLRVLPENGGAILDISGFHEVGHSVDHHRDMRLDIDHMSYEELLALGEQIGSAGSGLSDAFILEHLKTRVFASSKPFESEDASFADQELNSCVICQNNYEDKEQMGVLDCGHEYHVECVKKWLTVKNTCPVCKSTGLAAQAKES